MQHHEKKRTYGLPKVFQTEQFTIDKGIRVGVSIGIDPEHPDLKGKILAEDLLVIEEAKDAHGCTHCGDYCGGTLTVNICCA